LILLTVFCGFFSARASDLNSLEELVGQWVGLRSEISEENQAWKSQKRQWQQEIALLEKESSRLNEMIALEKQLTQAKEGVVANQLERRDELRAVVVDVGLIADQYAVVVSAIKQRIPAPLQSENLVRGCDITSNTGLASTRRLQKLLSSLSEIEKIKHSSHIVRELIVIEGGGRREMDVAYIGLAMAYAVSLDNSVAAIGSPVSTGWTKDLDIAADVRKLIDIKQQKRPPEIINLPINGAVGELPQNLVVLPMDKYIVEAKQ